jgi:uroporphyrinogen decarboxylase
MYGEPELWSQLLDRLATITLAFLRVQIDAGASAVQLFDSWVGALPAADYRPYVQPHSARVLAAVSDVPRIHFGVGTGELLHDMGEAGRGRRRRRLAGAAVRRGAAHRPGQGGAGQPRPDAGLRAARRRRAQGPDALEEGKAAEGHVFNLGHGVLPETDPDVLLRVVELVHAGL